MQMVPLPQTRPHPPQLEFEVAVSVQVAPHWAVPAGQAQRLLAQTVPPMHALPQPPQFSLDVAISTQAPPQLSLPPEQTRTHAPALQTCGAGQAWPQAPQLAGSDFTITHAA